MNQIRKLIIALTFTICPFISVAENKNPNQIETFNKATHQLSSARFLSTKQLNLLAHTWGGGKIKSFESKKYKRSVKVLLRSQTSGVPSTEALFFTNSRELTPGWQLALHYPLVLMETLRVEEKGNGLSLYAFRHIDKLKIERFFIPYETLVGPVIADLQAYPYPLEQDAKR